MTTDCYHKRISIGNLSLVIDDHGNQIGQTAETRFLDISRNDRSTFAIGQVTRRRRLFDNTNRESAIECAASGGADTHVAHESGQNQVFTPHRFQFLLQAGSCKGIWKVLDDNWLTWGGTYCVGNGAERLRLTSTDTYDSRRLEWFADEEPTQNFHSVSGNDFLLILKTRYTDEGDLVGTAVDDVASWSGSASRHDDASVDYEANRWGEHFEMIRDADGEWGMVVYEATDPRRATFSRESSQSSVFNPASGEFDGS